MTVTQDKIELPSTICWLSHEQSANFLGVHISQYRRDSSLLDSLGIIQRDKYAKGCDRNTLETLQEFRRLAVQRGRKSAAKELLLRRNQNGN